MLQVEKVNQTLLYTYKFEFSLADVKNEVQVKQKLVSKQVNHWLL